MNRVAGICAALAAKTCAVLLICAALVVVFGRIWATPPKPIERGGAIAWHAYSEPAIWKLYTYKRQWQTAITEEERATLKGIALHEFQVFDRDRLPADLLSFLDELED